MRYNVENDACEEISTGTVIDIDENCWYYDFELESCLSKDEFDDQFGVKPTEVNSLNPVVFFLFLRNINFILLFILESI